MNDKFIDTIYDLINIIKNDEFASYFYNKGAFSFIDKENCINIKIREGIDIYEVIDYITATTYVIKREVLHDDARIFHIAIQDNEQLYYYRILEVMRNTYCIKALKKNEEQTIECMSTKIDWNDKQQLLEFVEAFMYEIAEQESEDFEQEIDEYNQEIVSMSTANEQEISIKLTKNEDKDGTDNSNDSIPEEVEVIVDDSEYETTTSIHDVFEEISFGEYSRFILYGQDDNNVFHNENILGEEEVEDDQLVDDYGEYLVKFNGEEVEKKRASIIAFNFDMAAESRYLDGTFKRASLSILLDVLKERVHDYKEKTQTSYGEERSLE